MPRKLETRRQRVAREESLRTGSRYKYLENLIQCRLILGFALGRLKKEARTSACLVERVLSVVRVADSK